MENEIAILSLVIAALAVFFGPLLQLCIARRQMKATLTVAKKQIVSPIRQKWIDDLRGHVAQLISTAQGHWIYPKDPETTHKNLLLIERKIELMLNPNESDHQALRKELDRLIEVVLRRQTDATPLSEFTKTFSNATSMAQKVFKREWERVKNE